MHDHVHDHDHCHGPREVHRAFAIGIALNVIFVVTEAGFGFISNSLALLADAGHNLGDVLGLLLAWGAGVLARRLPTQRRTYGLRRTSVLAALANGMLLLVAALGIGWEAIRRLQHPEPVQSEVVMLVASIGILVNGFTAWLFMAGKDRDINIRAAYLHMAADAGISFGVVVTAVALHFTGWVWLDPLVSLAIAAAIGAGTWSLLRESVNLALDAVPGHIDPAEVEAYLAGLPGVMAVHDLHIWAMSTTENALMVHLVKPDAVIDDALLGRINHDLREKFRIQHTTVQFERGDEAHPCKQAPLTAL